MNTAISDRIESPSRVDRRERLMNEFDKLPRGARAAAAQDLAIAPTIVSGIINGKIHRDDLLGKLERWVATVTAEDIANRRDRSSGQVAGVWGFLNDVIENDPRAMTDAQQVYNLYVERASEHGHRPASLAKFLSTLQLRYPVTRIDGEPVFAGFRLKSSTSADD